MILRPNSTREIVAQLKELPSHKRRVVVFVGKHPNERTDKIALHHHKSWERHGAVVVRIPSHWTPHGFWKKVHAMHNEGQLELAKLEKMHAEVPDDNQLTHLLAESGVNVPVIHLHGGSEPEKVEVNVSPDSPLKITNAVNATGWKKSIVDRHNDQNYARSQITIEYPFKGRERKRPDAVLRTGGYTAELGFRSHASMSYLYLIARIASKKEVRDFKKHAPTFERLLIELAKGD